MHESPHDPAGPDRAPAAVRYYRLRERPLLWSVLIAAPVVALAFFSYDAWAWSSGASKRWSQTSGWLLAASVLVLCYCERKLRSHHSPPDYAARWKAVRWFLLMIGISLLWRPALFIGFAAWWIWAEPLALEVLTLDLWALLRLGLSAVGGLLLLVAWRFSRRYEYRAENRCFACGYNLAFNTSGICPECGRAVARAGGLPDTGGGDE